MLLNGSVFINELKSLENQIISRSLFLFCIKSPIRSRLICFTGPLNYQFCYLYFIRSVLSIRRKKLDRHDSGISRSFLASNRGMPTM